MWLAAIALVLWALLRCGHRHESDVRLLGGPLPAGAPGEVRQRVCNRDWLNFAERPCQLIGVQGRRILCCGSA